MLQYLWQKPNQGYRFPPRPYHVHSWAQLPLSGEESAILIKEGLKGYREKNLFPSHIARKNRMCEENVRVE
jgi:hypothetical protein